MNHYAMNHHIYIILYLKIYRHSDVLCRAIQNKHVPKLTCVLNLKINTNNIRYLTK